MVLPSACYRSISFKSICLIILIGSRSLAGVEAADTAQGPNKAIETARQQVTIALEQAQRSLGPHTPGSGHTKQYMQRVLNMLEGQNGKDFNAKVETPGDGQGIIPHLTAIKEILKKSTASPDVEQALDQAILLVQEAAEHAKRSIHATTVEETHRHAGLAAGLLVAASGQEGSRSPIAGALGYVTTK